MELICDFCSSKPVTARYHAEDFEVYPLSSPELRQGSVGDWAACAVCEKFIDASDWSGVALRSVNLLFLRHPELEDIFAKDQVFEELLLTYKLLLTKGFRKGTL